MSDPATVLIVEDEFVIAELLEMALTDMGYRVVKAANGRQALERLAEGPLPDLVLSDFMMPVMDGAGLVKAMSQIDCQNALPIIIMSSMPEANVHSRIDHYAAFIRKPFKIGELMGLIETIIGPPQPAV